jgi:hypothetical protein
MAAVEKVEMEDMEEEEIEGGAVVEFPKLESEEGGGMHVGPFEMSGEQVPFIGCFFAAMVLVVAMTTKTGITDHDYYGYGISVAVIAMFFSLVGFAFTKIDMGEKLPMYNKYLLFLWTFIGACFLTFERGPFPKSSNGYFAAWGTTVFAVMSLGISADKLKGAGSNMGLLASSIVLLAAITSFMLKYSGYKGELTYAIIVASLSILALAFFMKMEKDGSEPHNIKFPVLALFSILWVVNACLLTFSGPFIETGNGYFSAWGGCVTSVFAAMSAKT